MLTEGISLQPAHGRERSFSVIALRVHGFINNNEFILPKTVCFVTVQWCQSWVGGKVHGAPNPVMGGCAPPDSAAYEHVVIGHTPICYAYYT